MDVFPKRQANFTFHSEIFAQSWQASLSFKKVQGREELVKARILFLSPARENVITNETMRNKCDFVFRNISLIAMFQECVLAFSASSTWSLWSYFSWWKDGDDEKNVYGNSFFFLRWHFHQVNIFWKDALKTTLIKDGVRCRNFCIDMFSSHFSKKSIDKWVHSWSK